VGDVDLVTTVWERTYRTALTTEFFDRIETQVGPQPHRTVLINNVADWPAVEALAQSLVNAGTITRYIFVAHHLDAALSRFRLRRGQLEPMLHYSDHFLVSAHIDGPRWLLFWDTDVVLDPPGDWVTPTADLLDRRPDVLVGCPAWRDPVTMREETLSVDGPFNLGYGFSDQTWLMERSRLREANLRLHAPASWWYHTAPVTRIFEQRVDAYARRRRLLRAVYRPVVAAHDEVMAAAPVTTNRQRAKRKVQAAARRLLEQAFSTNPVFVRRPSPAGDDRAP